MHLDQFQSQLSPHVVYSTIFLITPSDESGEKICSRCYPAGRMSITHQQLEHLAVEPVSFELLAFDVLAVRIDKTEGPFEIPDRPVDFHGAVIMPTRFASRQRTCGFTEPASAPGPRPARASARDALPCQTHTPCRPVPEASCRRRPGPSASTHGPRSARY